MINWAAACLVSGGGRIDRRLMSCAKPLEVGAARTFARGPEHRHQDQIDPGSIHEQKSLENAFFLETAGRVGRNRPRIVAEYDKADALEIEMVPTIVERHRQRLFAKALAAVPFVADPHAEVRRAMNGVDVVDVDIADDLRVSALAYREHDPRRIAAGLTRGDDVPEVYRPEGAVESCGGNVVRPAIHRTIVIRYESAEGDPWSEKHLGTLLEVGVPNAASVGIRMILLRRGANRGAKSPHRNS